MSHSNRSGLSSHSNHSTARPSSPYTNPPSAGSGSTSSLDFLPPSILATGTDLSKTVSVPTPIFENEVDRGRSSSRASTRPNAPNRGISDSTNTSLNSETNTTTSTSRKIRFAPLPEIRPRSYSTGHNIWLDNDSVDPSEARSPHIQIRRDGENPNMAMYDDDALDSDDDDDDQDDDLMSPVKAIFGSWKSDLVNLGAGGGASSSSRTDESSYSKLLRPLSFGMVGKKKKSSGRPSTSEGRSESLTRTSSNDSDVSKRTSMSSINDFRPTGIPMRKTRTWESNESSPVREPRRANYPPVAQRSRNRRPVAPISVSAPAFNEWGSTGSVGSVAKSGTGASNEEEDDGGGMAWIRKRRAQREAEAARKKAEEEEAERKRLEEEEEDLAKVDDAEDAELCSTMDLDDEEEADGGMGGKTPTTSTPRQSLAMASFTPIGSSAQSTSNPNAAKYEINGTASPNTLRSGTPEPSPAQRAAAVEATTQSLTQSPSKDRSSDEDEDLSHSESEDDDGDSRNGDDDDDDDSDLDEEELAREEALANQARVTAVCAGTEKYHSANHHAVVKPSQDSTPNGSRIITTPSRQATLTQDMFDQNVAH